MLSLVAATRTWKLVLLAGTLTLKLFPAQRDAVPGRAAVGAPARPVSSLPIRCRCQARDRGPWRCCPTNRRADRGHRRCVIIRGAARFSARCLVSEQCSLVAAIAHFTDADAGRAGDAVPGRAAASVLCTVARVARQG